MDYKWFIQFQPERGNEVLTFKGELQKILKLFLNKRIYEPTSLYNKKFSY